MTNVVIVDYGMGNIRSVEKKLSNIGVNAIVSRNNEVINNADKLVLPGVGHFANGVRNLKLYGLWDILNDKVLIKHTPVLGICLGMHLMARHSEEGSNTEGLGWFDADVVRFRIKDKLKFKIPHMGWNNITVKKDHSLFRKSREKALYYFVHSYHITCNDPEDILATTTYEYEFTSSVQKNNILGTQFHPEKSHDYGEVLLRNFISI